MCCNGVTAVLHLAINMSHWIHSRIGSWNTKMNVSVPHALLCLKSLVTQPFIQQLFQPQCNPQSSDHWSFFFFFFFFGGGGVSLKDSPHKVTVIYCVLEQYRKQYIKLVLCWNDTCVRFSITDRICTGFSWLPPVAYFTLVSEDVMSSLWQSHNPLLPFNNLSGFYLWLEKWLPTFFGECWWGL